MSNVKSMRELTNEEINMVAGGVVTMTDRVREGVGDVVMGLRSVFAGQVNTGLGSIGEGINDIRGRS